MSSQRNCTARALDLPSSQSSQVTKVYVIPRRATRPQIQPTTFSEILSEANKRIILLQIKRHSFIRNEDICKLIPASISPCTISQMLKESGYGHWKAQKRPGLTGEAAKLCYEWVYMHRDWAYEQ